MVARNNYLLKKGNRKKTRIEADKVPLTAPAKKQAGLEAITNSFNYHIKHRKLDKSKGAGSIKGLC